jgi:MFS family permease
LSTVEAEAGGVIGGGELARAQHALVQDAAWASLIGVLSGGVVLVGFALALGAGPLTIGLLGAIPALGQLAQLPAIVLVERLRRRRLLAVWLGVSERVVVLLLAILPFLPDRGLALMLLVAAEVLIASTAAMSACAWNSWMHDLLPRQGHGGVLRAPALLVHRGFAAGGLAAGALVDHWPGREPLHAYAAAFIGAALAGFVSSWFLARVPEPPMAPLSACAPRLSQMLGRPLRDPVFRKLILFLASWSFSTNLAAPFITVYLLEQLDIGLGLVVGVWACSQLANGLTVGLWGRLSDRMSNKAVLMTAAPAVLACLLVLPAAGVLGPLPVLLVAIHLVMGVATGGTALASGNIALRLAPRGEGMAYMAAIGMCNAGAAAVAPLLGGLLADWFAVRELSVMVTWHAPGSEVAFTPVHLRHWEFFFVLAAATGLYALHALGAVQEGEGPGRRGWCRTLSWKQPVACAACRARLDFASPPVSQSDAWWGAARRESARRCAICRKSERPAAHGVRPRRLSLGSLLHRLMEVHRRSCVQTTMLSRQAITTFWPGPPSSTSRPGPPMRTSSPPCPNIVSAPFPPNNTSSPSPPSAVSAITAASSLATNTSSPAPVLITRRSKASMPMISTVAARPKTVTPSALPDTAITSSLPVASRMTVSC